MLESNLGKGPMTEVMLTCFKCNAATSFLPAFSWDKFARLHADADISGVSYENWPKDR